MSKTKTTTWKRVANNAHHGGSLTKGGPHETQYAGICSVSGRYAEHPVYARRKRGNNLATIAEPRLHKPTAPRSIVPGYFVPDAVEYKLQALEIVHADDFIKED